MQGRTRSWKWQVIQERINATCLQKIQGQMLSNWPLELLVHFLDISFTHMAPWLKWSKVLPGIITTRLKVVECHNLNRPMITAGVYSTLVSMIMTQLRSTLGGGGGVKNAGS